VLFRSVTVKPDPTLNTTDAVDDTATTMAGDPLTVDVLANDTDPEGDVQTITSLGDPLNGTVQIVGGKVVYTPNDGFVGNDVFTYTVTDANGATDTATVSVSVTAKPVNTTDAVSDVSMTDAGTPVTIDVLANDTDPEGHTQTITSTNQPLNGTAAIVNGQIVYTPNAGFAGVDTFIYTITDSEGATDTTHVNVTVKADPTINTTHACDDVSMTEFNQPVTVDVLANDFDPQGDAQTVTAVGTPTNGSVQIVNGKVVYTPNTGFSGQDTFTYTVTDAQGATDTATVTVTVKGDTNTTDAVSDASMTDFNQPVTIDVLANDTDPEGHTQTITATNQPLNGTAEIVNGKIVYTPNTGFVGNDTFTYTITDELGATDTTYVVVNVKPDPNGGGNTTNAVDDASMTDFDMPVTINVLGNDTDPENDVQSISAVGTPTNGTAVISNGQVI